MKIQIIHFRFRSIADLIDHRILENETKAIVYLFKPKIKFRNNIKSKESLLELKKSLNGPIFFESFFFFKLIKTYHNCN